MISRNLLLEPKQILEEDYNLKLTISEVTEIGVTLLNFTETLLKVESENDNEKQQTVKTN